MNKIAVIENTNILKLRIDKLLESLNLQSVEVAKVRYQNKVHFNHSFEDIDLILVDIDNLGQKSSAFIDEIKNSPHASDIPIIAISVHSDIKTLKKVISKGCIDFIMKPFDNNTFVSKVEKFLATQINNDTVRKDLIDVTIEDAEKIQLVWSDDFKIDVEQIDLEHKSLFDHFQKLYSYMKEGRGHDYYNELIAFLEQYITNHFDHEESFQKKIEYPIYENHQKLHESFKSSIDEIIITHKDKKITDLDLIRINLFLQDWLLHHVLIEDQKIANYYNEKNTST